MVANEILLKLLDWANQVLPEEADLDVPALRFQLPERVLVVAPRFIGDNILLTPLLRNLRNNLPASARLDVMTTAPVAPLYETFPGVDRVFIEKTDPADKPRAFLKQQGYDTVFLCRYSPVWGRAALQAQVSQRVGFDLERLGIRRLRYWGRCLTHTIPSRSVFDNRSQVLVYLDILQRLGMAVSEPALECHLLDADFHKARQLLSALPPGPRMLIHAGSGSPGKNWPLPYWERLLCALQTRYDPVFVTIGSRKEADLYRPWEHRFRLANWCGQTSLRESVALLRDIDLVISLDTSVVHMAALAGTPRVTVLYGPTNEKQWRPLIAPGARLEQVALDLPCRPCLARTCEHKACLLQLTPERVLEAVERLMG